MFNIKITLAENKHAVVVSNFVHSFLFYNPEGFKKYFLEYFKSKNMKTEEAEQMYGSLMQNIGGKDGFLISAKDIKGQVLLLFNYPKDLNVVKNYFDNNYKTVLSENYGLLDFPLTPPAGWDDNELGLQLFLYTNIIGHHIDGKNIRMTSWLMNNISDFFSKGNTVINCNTLAKCVMGCCKIQNIPSAQDLGKGRRILLGYNTPLDKTEILKDSANTVAIIQSVFESLDYYKRIYKK